MNFFVSSFCYYGINEYSTEINYKNPVFTGGIRLSSLEEEEQILQKRIFLSQAKKKKKLKRTRRRWEIMFVRLIELAGLRFTYLFILNLFKICSKYN